MSVPHHRWLLQQLPQWEREGLVTTEAANTLRHRSEAAAAEGSSHLAQMAMGVLGALLIGTGLIAVIGYNWDDFPRPVRLLFAFIPLLLTQLFSLWVLRRDEAAALWWREVAALLQTLAAGACILLVSQIYNIAGDWPAFLLVWCLLALPLIWVFSAHAVTLFYLISTAVWVANKAATSGSGAESPWLYLGLLAGLLPYLFQFRRLKRPLPNLVRWIGVISIIVGLGAVAVHAAESKKFARDNPYLFLWLINVALLVLIPLTAFGRGEPVHRKPQVVLGFLILLGAGLAMTFADVMRDIAEEAAHAFALPWTWCLLAILAAFVALAVWQRRWAVLAVAGIVILPFAGAGGSESFTAAGAWVATSYLFLAGLVLIVLEFSGRQGAPRLGAALLSVLIIVRFSDSHFSLLHKGVIFIIVGACFLAFNMFVGRWRRAGRSLS